MSDNQIETFFNQAVDEIINEERRNIKIIFCITPSEERQLRSICQGAKISHYIRSHLFGYVQPRPRQIIPRINRATYVKLAKITKVIEKQTEVIDKAISLKVTPKFSQGYLNELRELKKLITEVRREIAINNTELDETNQEGS